MAEDRRRANLLIYGGLGLLGLGGVLWLQQSQAPAPKPVPAPTPAPAPAPTPAPAPAPAPITRTQTVCGCAPDALGNCTTWCSTLWGIAAHYYGSGALYPRIYSANAALIEVTARAHGFGSSDGGHWIFPGMVLTIP